MSCPCDLWSFLSHPSLLPLQDCFLYHGWHLYLPNLPSLRIHILFWNLQLSSCFKTEAWSLCSPKPLRMRKDIAKWTKSVTGCLTLCLLVIQQEYQEFCPGGVASAAISPQGKKSPSLFPFREDLGKSRGGQRDPGSFILNQEHNQRFQKRMWILREGKLGRYKSSSTGRGVDAFPAYLHWSTQHNQSHLCLYQVSFPKVSCASDLLRTCSQDTQGED